MDPSFKKEMEQFQNQEDSSGQMAGGCEDSMYYYTKAKEKNLMRLQCLQ